MVPRLWHKARQPSELKRTKKLRQVYTRLSKKGGELTHELPPFKISKNENQNWVELTFKAVLTAWITM